MLHLTKQSFRNRKLYLHCYAILSTKVSDKHFFKLYRSVLFFLISHLKYILFFSLLLTCSFKLLSCNFFQDKICSIILLQNLLITQELTKLSEKYLQIPQKCLFKKRGLYSFLKAMVFVKRCKIVV